MKPGVADIYIPGEDKFIEVKSVGDGIRFNQIKWIKKHDYRVEFVFIEENEEKDIFVCSNCDRAFDSETARKCHNSQNHNFNKSDEDPPIKLSMLPRTKKI